MLRQFFCEAVPLGGTAARGASRWTSPDGDVGVSCADVRGTYRGFGLVWFHNRYDSRSGVLVSSKET